jgi:predicted alpha/beta superfamily hydrolase
LPWAVEWTLHSSLLNEDRTITVHLPDDYDQSTTLCPVVYTWDGEEVLLPVVGVAAALPWAQRAPDVIVVAIHNPHRTHDYTTEWTSAVSPAQAQWMVAKAGGADWLLGLLKTELLPEIERRYRTSPFRILIGHSLGGLFALHAFVTSRDLFSATIALSPPAFWNGDESIDRAVRLFNERPNLKG